MPELPEVETIRAQLSGHLPLKIESCIQSTGLQQNILKTPLALEGKTIVQIKRKGKMLDFVFDDGTHLLSHLGMTGTWLIGPNARAGKHAHLVLNIIDNSLTSQLIYDDPRRFGKMYYGSDEDTDRRLRALGLDLSDDALDEKYLTKIFLKYPERFLKVTLLDQKFFAGSGNYIANEICARAKIKPNRRCKKLSRLDIQNVLRAIRQVIEPALEAGGTTFQGGYRDSSGEKGKGKSHLVVFYQKICQMCGRTPIKKTILAQRGTYHCPRCQK